DHGAARPLEEPAPVLGADEDDGEGPDLARLDEGEGLPQLVHRAEAAGQHDEAEGVLDEHRLAGEEVPEVDAEVDPLVHALLEGQLDAEPDGHAARLAGALVRRLHDTGTTAGDDGVARLDEPSADLLAQGVLVGVGLAAGGAEDADRRPELGQRPEALDELALDPHDPPRV